MSILAVINVLSTFSTMVDGDWYISILAMVVSDWRISILVVQTVLLRVNWGANLLLCCLIVGIRASGISIPLSLLMLSG